MLFIRRNAGVITALVMIPLWMKLGEAIAQLFK